MRGAQELLLGLVRMALIAAGVFYSVQILVACAKNESHERPSLDPTDRLRSAARLLLWIGVVTVGVIGQLARPLMNTLSEASAEVGEWAISRRQQVLTRSRAK
jgi:hypothetical protein